jgi:hypothetical protein
MPVLPFESKNDVVNFAKAFLRIQVWRFRKDIVICLRRGPKGSHAYFPALITCLGFADFLSGLYAGKLDGHAVNELKTYASKFMDRASYDSERIDILYEMFRHKVAHLAIPYEVFDTHSKSRLKGQPRRLLTWKVLASRRKPSIKIIAFARAKQIKQDPSPWKTHYDHRVSISVRALAADITSSIYGRSGYLHCLKTDAAARDRFKNCMKFFYPKA